MRCDYAYGTPIFFFAESRLYFCVSGPGTNEFNVDRDDGEPGCGADRSPCEPGCNADSGALAVVAMLLIPVR
jgi:hypothetical protein